MIVFNLFDVESGEGITSFQINTYHWRYRKDPELIFETLVPPIKAMARIKAICLDGELPPIEIKSRTLHLAIPDATSATQYWVLWRAIEYAAALGVKLAVTRIIVGRPSATNLERQIETLWERIRYRHGRLQEPGGWAAEPDIVERRRRPEASG